MQKSINGLSPGSTYIVQVASIDGQGQSDWSPTLEVTIPVPALTPNAPTNVTATGNPDSIKISWTQATLNTDNTSLAQPAYYQVYQSFTPTVDTFGTPVGKTSGSSFTYLTTMYDTNQYFKVLTVDGFGNKSVASTLVNAKVDEPSVMSGLITQVYSYNRSATGGTVAFTTVSPHGVTGGDKVYISGSYGGTGATGVDTISGAPATVLSSPLPTATGFSAVNSLTGNIVNISSSSAAITGVTGNGSLVTYTSTYAPAVGERLTISNVIPNQYNIKGVVVTASTASTFSVSSAATGTYISGGMVIGDMPAYMYPSDNAVRVKSDGITVGNMSTGFIVGISPTSFNMQSSSSSTRLALTSNEIAMYKSGTQSVSIKSDGSFLLRSVTGGSGAQKIVIDPTGLALYDTSGTKTVGFDSETGDATIYGSISNGFVGSRVEIDKTDKNRIAMYSDAMFHNTFTVSQKTLYNSVTGVTLFIDNAYLIEPTTGGTAFIETSRGTQRFSYASKAYSPDRLIGCFLMDEISGTGATAATGSSITTDQPATINITDDSWWEGRLDIESGVPGRVGGTLGPAFISMLPDIPGVPAQIFMSPIKVNDTYAVAVGGVGITSAGIAITVYHGLGYTPSTVVATPRDNTYTPTRTTNIYVGNIGSTSFTVFATNNTTGIAAAFAWMAV